MSAGPISLRSRSMATSLSWMVSSALAWKKSDSLHPDELACLDQNLEQLVLLVAGHAGPGQGLLWAGRSRRRAQEVGLELVDDLLLLRRSVAPRASRAGPCRARPDHALGLERAQQVGEDPLVRRAGPAPELLARHARP